MIKKIKKFLPGIALVFIIALIAKGLESLLPIPFISASVIALFIGISLNHWLGDNKPIRPGVELASKRFLKIGIIFLGANLNVMTILNVGQLSLSVMIFTLLTCFGVGYFVGKGLGLNWKVSNLISAGTGICGGSAIGAIAPVIEAEDSDIAFAMSATFIYDMLMIVCFPLMGHWLKLSDIAYGLWTGTAVNDTSSVVAAGYAFSEAAGDFATMVKLTRTLVIIPTVLIFAFIHSYSKNKALKDSQPLSMRIHSIVPWFILGFLGLAALNSLAIIPESSSLLMKDWSKFLMITALAAIGLKTQAKTMFKSGLKPMIHGFIISTLVIIVSITVEYFMGLL